MQGVHSRVVAVRLIISARFLRHVLKETDSQLKRYVNDITTDAWAIIAHIDVQGTGALELTRSQHSTYSQEKKVLSQAADVK